MFETTLETSKLFIQSFECTREYVSYIAAIDKWCFFFFIMRNDIKRKVTKCFGKAFDFYGIFLSLSSRIICLFTAPRYKLKDSVTNHGHDIKRQIYESHQFDVGLV